MTEKRKRETPDPGADTEPTPDSCQTCPKPATHESTTGEPYCAECASRAKRAGFTIRSRK